MLIGLSPGFKFRALVRIRNSNGLDYFCVRSKLKKMTFSSRVPEDPEFKFRDFNYYCLLFQFFEKTIPGSGTSIT